MRRLAPWLLLLLGVGLGLALLLPGEEGPAPYSPEALEEFGRPGEGSLPTLAQGQGRPTPTAAPPTRVDPDEAGGAETRAGPVRLKGRVLSATGRRPLADAEVWIEPASTPCGAIPSSLSPAPEESGMEGVASQPLARVRTDAKGQFEFRSASEFPLDIDVYARAAGHGCVVACRPSPEREIELLLPVAFMLKGRVLSMRGDPVAQAQIYAVPAETTPQTLHHAAHAVSDLHGNFLLGGVAGGAVHMVVHHPLFMTHRSSPVEPAEERSHDIVLIPALRLSLQLRSEDGREINNPVLHWRTRGQPPKSSLQMLTARAVGPSGMERSELEAVPVKLPCDQREADLEVKADGYAPWRPAQPLLLPADGGPQTLQLTLERDDSLASLRLRFEDEQGQPVSYASLGGVPRVARLDGVSQPSGIVIDSTEFLAFPSLTAGPWRIYMYCKGHAPISIEVDLAAGTEREETVVLRPAARLNLRFTHPFPSEEPVLVRFVFLTNEVSVPVFPEEGDSGTADAQTGVQAAGEGKTFGGLAPGKHVIEVRTPGLATTRHEVRLRAGEVEEVEIEVQRP